MTSIKEAPAAQRSGGKGGRIALILGTAALIGCSSQADLSAVNAERAKAVQRYDISQALATNSKVVIAGSQAGAVLVSADQGRSWKRTPLGPVSLIGLATCPDGSFIGIDFYRKLWSADAQGESWKPAPFEKPRVPLTLACDPLGRWWVAGTRATLAMSADKGATWQVTDLGKDAQLTTLEFIDAKNAIATGEFGMVIASSDGGATWTPRGKMPGDFYPYATLFTSPKDGWASGLAGQMLHTTDGGATWTKAAPAPAPLYRLFLHNGVPHGVGAVGTLARLDGGIWRGIPYPDASPVFLGAAVSLPGQSALIAGGPGGLLRVIGTHAN